MALIEDLALFLSNKIVLTPFANELTKGAFNTSIFAIGEALIFKYPIITQISNKL